MTGKIVNERHGRYYQHYVIVLYSLQQFSERL